MKVNSIKQRNQINEIIFTFFGESFPTTIMTTLSPAKATTVTKKNLKIRMSYFKLLRPEKI
jgi:hypothetical protein